MYKIIDYMTGKVVSKHRTEKSARTTLHEMLKVKVQDENDGGFMGNLLYYVKK